MLLSDMFENLETFLAERNFNYPELVIKIKREDKLKWDFLMTRELNRQTLTSVNQVDVAISVFTFFDIVVRFEIKEPSDGN